MSVRGSSSVPSRANRTARTSIGWLHIIGSAGRSTLRARQLQDTDVQSCDDHPYPRNPPRETMVSKRQTTPKGQASRKRPATAKPRSKKGPAGGEGPTNGNLRTDRNVLER